MAINENMNKVIMRRYCLILFVVIAVCVVCYAQQQKPTNIILITLDTVRADHLRCYGYKNIKTPSLDLLASKGVLFENAFTSAPITLPAHASILTGLYPFHTKVRNNGTYMLPSKTTTVATLLQDKGYHTAAFISAAVLHSMYNLNQGFELYDERLDYHRIISGEYLERRADSVTKAALEWLRTNRNHPYFIWIHYYDPHALYEPPEPFLTQYKQHPYDGEIANVDSQLAEVIRFAETEGKAGNPVLIVVVADHGEGLWDHGEPEHGIFLYRETIRVPLIFTWFPKRYPNRRIAETVRTVDIVPTVLDYLSVPIPGNLDGISLLPRIKHTGKLESIPAYSETFLSREDFGWSQLFSIQNNEWKFILAPQPELYNIVHDHSEKHNVIGGTNAGIANSMEQQLRAMPIQITAAQSKPAMITPEEMEKLTALGYAGHPNASAEHLPDSKDQLELIKIMYQAGTLFLKGQYHECIPLLREVVKLNANSRQALIFLADAYLEIGNAVEAIECTEKNIQLGDESGIFHYNLGNIYYKLGNSEKAEFYYRKAIAINPFFSNALFTLAYLEFQQNKLDDAKQHLVRSLQVRSRDANANYLLGSIEAQSNDFASAIEHFRNAVAIDPLNSEAWKNLARACYMKKEFQNAIEAYQGAIAIQPGNADLYYKIAAIYFYDLHDNKNALIYFKKVIEIAPDHPDAPMIKRVIGIIENGKT
jgi:arylsulfatase A-like enzyme/tetratricopeptide (TPR) repeat protein